MHLPVTVGMEQREIRRMISAAMDAVENVMEMPTGFPGDFLVADWAAPVLGFPECDEGFPAFPPQPVMYLSTADKYHRLTCRPL